MTDDEIIETMLEAMRKAAGGLWPNQVPNDEAKLLKAQGVEPTYENWAARKRMHAALDAIRPEIDRRIAEARNAALDESIQMIDKTNQASRKQSNPSQFVLGAVYALGVASDICLMLKS